MLNRAFLIFEIICALAGSGALYFWIQEPSADWEPIFSISTFLLVCSELIRRRVSQKGEVSDELLGLYKTTLFKSIDLTVSVYSFVWEHQRIAQLSTPTIPNADIPQDDYIYSVSNDVKTHIDSFRSWISKNQPLYTSEDYLRLSKIEDLADELRKEIVDIARYGAALKYKEEPRLTDLFRELFPATPDVWEAVTWANRRNNEMRLAIRTLATEWALEEQLKSYRNWYRYELGKVRSVHSWSNSVLNCLKTE